MKKSHRKFSNTQEMQIATIVLVSLALIAFFAPKACPENIPDNIAVKAIIGEASGEGYKGMLAVAGALRNRGTIKGVYGVNSSHIKNEPKYVWEMAKKAWLESKINDLTLGATSWENIVDFGEPYWAKSMEETIRIGKHVFYREKI